jgi:hypothetical protein
VGVEGVGLKHHGEIPEPSGAECAGSPSIAIVPTLGKSKPAMILSSVDLPQPGRTDNRNDFTVVNFERDVVESLNAPGKTFRNVLETDRSHRNQRPQRSLSEANQVSARLSKPRCVAHAAGSTAQYIESNSRHSLFNCVAWQPASLDLPFPQLLLCVYLSEAQLTAVFVTVS